MEIDPNSAVTLADIEGPGAIQSTWFAGYVGRDFIIRIYWDHQKIPSVECPLGDFFGMHWVTNKTKTAEGPLTHINSIPIAVNPNRGLNCFWEMPFREHCRITLENTDPIKTNWCFYQINYTLTDVPDNAAYFHAQFRRINPLPYGEDYTILDGVSGCGHYVGTSMGWGEGEIKFYYDGDTK